MTVQQLTHQDVWHGEYKGFMFEIVNWSFGIYGDTQDKCNHYILIQVWKQPKLFNELLKFIKEDGDLDYYATPCANWDWHCGITFGEKISNKVIKVGCDYQHLHDEGNTYDVDYVYSEAIRTIDSITQKAE
jgi:hypothetical protein